MLHIAIFQDTVAVEAFVTQKWAVSSQVGLKNNQRSVLDLLFTTLQLSNQKMATSIVAGDAVTNCQFHISEYVCTS